MELWKKVFIKTVIPAYKINANQPYHNIHHMLYVKDQLEKVPHLYDKEILLAAAIVHDLGHSGGKHPDSVNITRAQTLIQKIPYLSAKIRNSLCKLVGYTQFPHVQKKDEIPITGRLLRDADISMCFHPEYFRNTFLPLAEEMNIQMTPEALITFLEGNQKFIENYEWQSEWGESLWDDNQAQFYFNIYSTLGLLNEYNMP